MSWADQSGPVLGGIGTLFGIPGMVLGIVALNKAEQAMAQSVIVNNTSGSLSQTLVNGNTNYWASDFWAPANGSPVTADLSGPAIAAGLLFLTIDYDVTTVPDDPAGTYTLTPVCRSTAGVLTPLSDPAAVTLSATGKADIQGQALINPVVVPAGGGALLVLLTKVAGVASKVRMSIGVSV